MTHTPAEFLVLVAFYFLSVFFLGASHKIPPFAGFFAFKYNIPRFPEQETSGQSVNWRTVSASSRLITSTIKRRVLS